MLCLLFITLGMFLAQVAGRVFVSPSDLTEKYNLPIDIATQIVAEVDIDGDGVLSRMERYNQKYNLLIDIYLDYENNGKVLDFASLKEIVNELQGSNYTRLYDMIHSLDWINNIYGS